LVLASRLLAVINCVAPPVELESEEEEEDPCGSSPETSPDSSTAWNAHEEEEEEENDERDAGVASRKRTRESGATVKGRKRARGSGCAKCRFSERGCKNCQGPGFMSKQELCGLLGIATKEYNQLEKQRDASVPIAKWESSLLAEIDSENDDASLETSLAATEPVENDDSYESDDRE